MKISPCELERRDLREAIKMVSEHLKTKRKNINGTRSNRVKMVCGAREYKLGNFSTNQTHNYSTSCNMLLNELRTCVGSGNWSAAATIVKFLLKMNGTLMPVIWRTSLLILLHHENASHQRLNDFLEHCLQLRSVLEKRSFLYGIFSMDGPRKVGEDDKQTKLTDFGLIRNSQTNPGWNKVESEDYFHSND